MGAAGTITIVAPAGLAFGAVNLVETSGGTEAGGPTSGPTGGLLGEVTVTGAGTGRIEVRIASSPNVPRTIEFAFELTGELRPGAVFSVMEQLEEDEPRVVDNNYLLPVAASIADD